MAHESLFSAGLMTPPIPADRLFGAGLLTPPILPHVSVCCRETFGRARWNGRETIPQRAPLTHHEILTRCPSPVTRPTPNTLWRWLSRACELGVLARHGSGSTTEAFRYGVTAGEEERAA